MPRFATLDEIQRPKRREATLDEINQTLAATARMGQTWAQEGINDRSVDVSNYMHRAGERIQQYQQARQDLGATRLTANEQVAIVDAYRQAAGLQPEGYYLTAEGAAVPKDRFAEIRRKRTEDDAWANFKSNLSETVLQNGAGIRAAQAKITDSLGITEGAVGNAARESEEVSRILQPLGGKSGFAGQAVGNVMNLFLAGTTAAPAMFATSTAGSTFLDVAQRRAEGQEISPYTEWTAAIANAAVEYALESFGQSVARRAGAKLAGRISGLHSAIAANGVRGGVRTAAATLAGLGIEQAGSALEGAAEEGITQVLQNTIKRLSYADEQGIFEDVGRAALQGAVMPFLASGPMAAIQYGKAGKPGAPTDIPLSSDAGEQALQNRPLEHLAAVEEAVKSEGRLPVPLQRSLPDEADLPALDDDIDFKRSDLMDKWIGDRQVAETTAVINAQNHRADLKNQLRDGEQLDHVNDAITLYVDMKENSDEYTAEAIQQLSPEHQAIVERAMSLSPDQQVFAEQIIAENRSQGIEAKEAGVIQNFKENYLARLWGKGTRTSKGQAKFTISTARARQRTLPSILEGWKRGLELEVPGAIEAQMIGKQQIAQVIHDRNLIALGKKSGVFSNARTDKHSHLVKHPNFATWEPKAKGPAGETEVFGKDVFVTPDGVTMVRSPVYANEKTARFLNNALGSSDLYNVPGVGTILKYNQIIKHTILTTSGFHYVAFARSFMLASRGVRPIKAYFEGQRLLQGKDPYTMELIHGGMTVGLSQDIDMAVQNESTAIGEIIDKVPMASDVRKALRGLSKANTKFLFGKVGPYLKVQAAVLEFKHQLKKQDTALREGRVSRREIVHNVANLMNDDFGGLNLQRMGRNPTIQAIHRAISLAPDWTESNVRSMVKAFKGGHEGQVYRALWGRVLMKGLGATIVSNLLLAGIDEDKTFFERYKAAWESGNLRWLDVDITPLLKRFGGQSPSRKYFSILGHLRDPVKFITHTGRSLKGKSSVIGRMTLDALTGRDWRGREFTTIGELMRNGETTKPVPFSGGELLPSQYPSFILKQAELSTPIQVQAAIQRFRGEIDTFDMITRSLGVPTSTVRPPKRTRRKRQTRQKRRK